MNFCTSRLSGHPATSRAKVQDFKLKQLPPIPVVQLQIVDDVDVGQGITADI